MLAVPKSRGQGSGEDGKVLVLVSAPVHSMAETFFRSRRLVGREAMVPPLKPTTRILPSQARLRGKGDGTETVKAMYIHTY